MISLALLNPPALPAPSALPTASVEAGSGSRTERDEVLGLDDLEELRDLATPFGMWEIYYGYLPDSLSSTGQYVNSPDESDQSDGNVHISACRP